MHVVSVVERAVYQLVWMTELWTEKWKSWDRVSKQAA